MKIFGYNITKKKASSASKITSKFLWPWAYGSKLQPEDNYEAFLKAYRGWVYVAANKNAISATSIPLKLYVGKPNNTPIKSHPTKAVKCKVENYIRSNASLNSLPQVRKATEIVEVLDHPLLSMLRSVNNFMNQFSLFELTNLYQELCGNAYWYIIENNLGVPQEIWPLPPQNMRIIPSKDKFISGYAFTRGMDEVIFPESSIIHFKFPSPTSLYYGRGPLSAVTDSFNISQNINKYENFVFGNMGRIEGAFETENELSQYEFDRLKEEISQTFRGLENVGKSPLLEKGVHYKPYGLAPKDLSFMQGRKAVKEEIINAYGQSMGLYDKDATRANAEVASFTHMKDTIKPRLTRMEEKLNEKLMPKFSDNLFVAFDDPVPTDREQQLKERETNLKTGYSSINMEREENNQPSVEWGDKPILNMNMVPLGEEPPSRSSDGGSGGNPEDTPDNDMITDSFIKENISVFTELLVKETINKLGAR